MSSTLRQIVSILSIQLLLFSVVGCVADSSDINRTFGAKRSYHLRGERVQLEFYDRGEAELFGLGEAVGVLVDLVEGGLRKEAARYTQSYGASGYRDASSLPAGFRVTRTIANPGLGNCDGSTPAGEYEERALASVVSVALDQVGSSRLYELKVDELQIRYSKAKISQFSQSGRLDLNLAVSVEGLWTDANGQYQKQNLTIGGGVTVRGVEICKVYKDKDDGRNPSLGYVYIPKIDGAKSGLVLRATVAVTERDSSRAAETFIDGADLLKQNRQSIINGASGLLSENATREVRMRNPQESSMMFAAPAQTNNRPFDDIKLDGYQFGEPRKGWLEDGLRNNFLLEANGVAALDERLPPIESFFFGIPETVCDPDDRVYVRDTTVAPWNAMCRLEITLPNGERAVGSGWLLTPTLVVTAGHCVHEGQGGQFFPSVVVIPGANGSIEPYGRRTSTILRASSGWTGHGSIAHDFGAIILDRPFVSNGASPSTLPMRVASDTELTQGEAVISGYPADRPIATQWFDFDSLARVYPDRIRYFIDTYGGQSGSAVMHGETAIGIHNYGGCPNSSTRITAEVHDQLLAWAREAGMP